MRWADFDQEKSTKSSCGGEVDQTMLQEKTTQRERAEPQKEAVRTKDGAGQNM